MKFEEALNEGTVIKITPNLERANSLYKSSTKTLLFAENNSLTSENSGVLLSNYYESLIEFLHSIAYKKGFKILDHMSFTYFIEEILFSKSFSVLFDKYRKIRNGVIYYGKEIDINTTKQAIKDIKEMINFLKKNFK